MAGGLSGGGELTFARANNRRNVRQQGQHHEQRDVSRPHPAAIVVHRYRQRSTCTSARCQIIHVQIILSARAVGCARGPNLRSPGLTRTGHQFEDEKLQRRVWCV